MLFSVHHEKNVTMNSRRSKGSSSASSAAAAAAAAAASAESERRAREIRDLQSAEESNKRCFDCGQRGPTYVNVTVGSFVCTRCSGTLRGLNPPHRIKSLSMSSFTADEVAMMRGRGNAWARKVYLGLYDSNRAAFDLKDAEGVRDFMIEKYEKRRYYVDPSTIVHTPAATTNGSSSAAASNSSSSFQKSSSTTTNLIGATLNARLASSSSSSSSAAAAASSNNPSTPAAGPLGVALPQPPSSSISRYGG